MFRVVAKYISIKCPINDAVIIILLLKINNSRNGLQISMNRPQCRPIECMALKVTAANILETQIMLSATTSETSTVSNKMAAEAANAQLFCTERTLTINLASSLVKSRGKIPKTTYACNFKCVENIWQYWTKVEI